MDVIPPDYPEGLYPLKQLGNDLSWEVGRLKSICKKLKITVSSVDGATYIPTDTKSILENWVIKYKKEDDQIEWNWIESDICIWIWIIIIVIVIEDVKEMEE